MPRAARLDAPGVVHHVIVRGIERRSIFTDSKDKDDFLERLGGLLLESQTHCYAWALLDNHSHLLVRTPVVSLATVMRRLLTGYAVTFNRRHRRYGHLFQNRYKSIICQEDIYFKELVRYIHLNPIRAGIVEDLRSLDCYPYCGHSALMGEKKRAWQDDGYVLGYFGKTVRVGRRNYRGYMEAGIDQGRREDLVGGGLIRSLGGWEEVARLRREGGDRVKGDERILGDSVFVERVLSEAEERFERRYELKRRGISLEKIVERVSELYGVEPHWIMVKGGEGRRVAARSLLCYWAVRELGMSLTDLARIFGMSPSSISYAVRRGETIVLKTNYQLLN